MTTVTYTLDNGTIVNTLAQAIASGRHYKVTYKEDIHRTEINPKPLKLSPIRQAMIDKFGYVNRSLRDKLD